MKILAVEDDPVARAIISASLFMLGHEVVEATDGEEAWDVLSKQDIRVVVCDWVMPKLDGLDLCRRVRARGGEYVYFILLTEMVDSDTNQDTALAAGVDDFLSKPANPREIKARLHVAERIMKYTSHIEKLESFIPICSYCKSVRDDQNYWKRIEAYINERTGSEFSHSVCPNCYEKHIVPQLEVIRRQGNTKKS